MRQYVSKCGKMRQRETAAIYVDMSKCGKIMSTCGKMRQTKRTNLPFIFSECGKICQNAANCGNAGKCGKMRQHGGKRGNSRQVLLWVKAGGHRQCYGQQPRTHALLSGPTCGFQDHSRSCHCHTSPDGSSQPGSHARVPCVMFASVQLAMICLN